MKNEAENELKNEPKMPGVNAPNVLSARGLIPIARKNDSYLPNSHIRILIAMPITVLLKAKGDLTVLIRRHMLY